ncbi:MAG: short-subunit dehydrogenase [Candidatus Azotimanducaceae bacterium]
MNGKKNKGTVLVTGASSGIGAALAKVFASNGYALVLTARRENLLQQLQEELSSVTDVSYIVSDIATREGVTALLAELETQEISIDVLVNNAGIAYSNDFDLLEDEQIQHLITLNITALSFLTLHFVKKMKSRGAGRILNVASVAAFQPVPSMSIYAASKAFVLSLTESLSEELRDTGVSVTALCPGLTNTDMAADLSASNVPPFMMSKVEDVAREGYEALMAREVIRIPGVANQAAVTWAKHQPRWLIRGIGGLVSRFTPNH